MSTPRFRRPERHVPVGLREHTPVSTREDLFDLSISEVTLPGDYAEFGVFNGKSAKVILRRLPEDRLFWLFDSFQGLPVDWDQGDTVVRKGAFNTNGQAPDIRDPRVKIVKGWFEDTVADWAKKQRDHLAFIHIDSDLYSSCKTVLEGIDHLITRGTVIQFDEIQGYPNYLQDEYRALREAPFDWEWLGRTSMYHASIKVVGRCDE